MKRIGLVFQIMFFLWNCGFSQEYDIPINDSVKYENPLIEKVFPGVNFLHQISYITTPPTTRIIGKYNGNIYYIPNLFNELLKAFEGKTNANLIEKTEAFFILLKAGQGKTIESFKLFEDSVHLDGREFNYRATYIQEGKTYSLLLIIEKRQLKEFRTYLGDKFKDGGNYFIIDNNNKSINIQNTDPLKEIFGGMDYYVKVSENESSTNNSQYSKKGCTLLNWF